MALDQQPVALALASLRLRLGDDIKEFQCAQRMLLRKAVLPRLRGEQGAHPGRTRRSHGSSPRARGTAGAKTPESQRPRFIPACAGNSFLIFLRISKYAVHPRVRGEQ